jgi:hypothetical protein
MMSGQIPDFPKTLKAHRIPVAIDRHTDLLLECATQVGRTDATLPCHFFEALGFGFLF